MATPETNLNRFLHTGTRQAGAGSRAPLLDNKQQIIMSDYRHAARIFVDGNFRLSPKYGFLFYVEFDFNPLITNISNSAAQEMGMIVKSASLPKFTIDTKVHNAYNRKNIVQNKIQYDPVTIVFHDDQADNVRSFWYDYYSYFYRDPDYADATYNAAHKYQSRPSFDWGYSPRPAVGYNNSNSTQPYQYIQSIRIYSLYQKNFSQYQLINPIITSFKHGDHVNGENNLLTHEMSVQFETVKYLTGYVTDDTVGGYIDLLYDRAPSPLSDQTNLVPDGMGGSMQATTALTDLANNTTSINPFLRSAADTVTPINGSASTASAMGGVTGSSSASVTNNGGIRIPGFGSLVQGATNGAALGQQLQAAAVGLAGRTAASLTGAVTGGIAAGLGKNGSAYVGLAAQVIANPSAALNTVTNMATQFAIAKASAYITNDLVNPLVNNISSSVGKFVTDSIAVPFGQAFDSLSLSVGNFFSTSNLPIDNIDYANF
jgi:hypothetical protein